MDKLELEKRLATEKELDKTLDTNPAPNVQFNETDGYILWASYLGINVYNLRTGEVVFTDNIIRSCLGFWGN